MTGRQHEVPSTFFSLDAQTLSVETKLFCPLFTCARRSNFFDLPCSDLRYSLHLSVSPLSFSSLSMCVPGLLVILEFFLMKYQLLHPKRRWFRGAARHLVVYYGRLMKVSCLARSCRWSRASTQARSTTPRTTTATSTGRYPDSLGHSNSQQQQRNRKQHRVETET